MNRRWTLLLALAASACAAVDGSRLVRPTHDDRWRAAMARCEAELATREAAPPAAVADGRPVGRRDRSR